MVVGGGGVQTVCGQGKGNSHQCTHVIIKTPAFLSWTEPPDGRYFSLNACGSGSKLHHL